MQVWIVGQKVGDDADAWEFQGVFSSKGVAERACRSRQYFVIPTCLDTELPHKSVESTEGYYPLALERS